MNEEVVLAAATAVATVSVTLLSGSGFAGAVVSRSLFQVSAEAVGNT